MSISPLYIPLFTIEEVILDKDSGLPLSGGVVKFYRDLQRATPKPVYQLSGNPPDYTFDSVGNELTLGIAGDFVDTDGDPFVPYAYPYDAAGELDLYYVTVESSGAVPQFTREAVPYTGDGTIPPEERSNTANELSNPQFVEVLFPTVGSYTIAVTGSNKVTAIAPDWDVISSGSGNIVVERLEPTSANVPTNPPYVLKITADAALGATVTLRQRLTHSPSFLRGEFVSATFTAAVISGGGSALSLTYAPSTGTATTIIPNTSIPTDAAYHTISGNAAITQQANDPAVTGYVDINITIPTARSIGITSIQIVGVGDSIDIPYDEQTTARQIDHLFHYYKPQLEYKPLPSYLVGWDFPLNPAQFLGATVPASAIGANKSKYVWDQTILFQSANSGIGITRGADDEIVLTAAVNSQAALIQYIKSPKARELINDAIAVNIAAASTAAAGLVCTVSLWYTTDVSLPSVVGSNNSLVLTLDANGKPATFNGNWTEVPRRLGINAKFTVTASTSTNPIDYNFNGWDLQGVSGILSATYFAIVIGTATITAADTLRIVSVGLMNGNIATRPAPQTADEVLRECQYYYEKSYAPATALGTSTSSNVILAPQNTFGTANLYVTSIPLQYKQTKIQTPAMTIWSADGTPNTISLAIFKDGALATASGGSLFPNPYNEPTAAWAFTPSVDRASIISQGTTTAQITATTTLNEGLAQFHYALDSRLGQ